ncbi:VCBS repeat-containing protein [Helicobacter sp. MIT 11-5569]|nr:VCBS repeat-containing protein [Helicobacter sp. MIT 11-5569]
MTNTQANSVPQSNIDKDGNGQTSEVLSSNTLSSGSLNDFQKLIVNKALEKVTQIKEEMLKTWEEIFGLKPSNSSNSSQNINLSIESLLNATLEQKALGSGISISQGFSQSLQVSIQGTIIASDGTKRQLDISIGISQSFMQNLQISGVGNNNTQTSNKKVIDPLVIDYEGSGTELSDTKMHFDLDSDGKPDQIATLKKGSGFLALDKNGDGKINDGSELFGTKSGDGFKDLSVYDANGDGKIDKEDPIYDKLRIWTPDGNGEGQLVGLGEKGIGVIYLNAQESQEMMRGENGDLLGIKQKTADFLFENGNNGKIHHIDLVSEKIKDEALQNQAQNDAILSQGGQSISQILASKAYGANINFQSTQATFAQNNTSSSGILSGILSNSNISFAQISNIEINISLSMSSLQSGKNGVSFELSQMWAKLESNFGKIQSNQNDNPKTTGNLVESLLNHFETSYKNINRLLFDPSTQKDSANTFDLNALNMLRITRLLGA